MEENPSAVSPVTPRFYRPELDVLRFIAFLLVFMCHAVPHPTRISSAVVASGALGLCLFFLLSGYLITELLSRELVRTQTIDLGHFYIRRILRIWPLYFAALLLAWLIDVHGGHAQMTGYRMAAFLLLAGNVYTARHGLPGSFAGILWSISVEEQFYLVWPGLRRVLSRRRMIAASIAIFLFSYATIFWLCLHVHAVDQQFWFNTFVQAQFFAVGGLLALIVQSHAPRWPWALRGLSFLTGLLAYVATAGLFDPSGFVSPWAVSARYLLAVLGSVMLFVSVLGFSELRHARWLIYLGKISYGLYVFHILAWRIMLRPEQWLIARTHLPVLLMDSVRAAGALILSILMAHLSYRYFESFFLRLKERYAAVRSRPV